MLEDAKQTWEQCCKNVRIALTITFPKNELMEFYQFVENSFLKKKETGEIVDFEKGECRDGSWTVPFGCSLEYLHVKFLVKKEYLTFNYEIYQEKVDYYTHDSGIRMSYYLTEKAMTAKKTKKSIWSKE
ncbi:MAG: hypothetical protein PHN44_11070, partial [Candidatus Marinimicrobia bacterium]|nr:hypothetical protein [Candidatus Neomarinimicrobiota bacterium]